MPRIQVQRESEKHLQNVEIFYQISEWSRRKKIIEKLFQEINTNSGLGSYGLKEVIEMLKNNIAGMIDYFR